MLALGWSLRRLSFEGSLFGPGREAKLEPSDPSPAALQTIGGRQRRAPLRGALRTLSLNRRPRGAAGARNQASMMSKSFFTSFFIQSIGFQQLVLQWGRAMGARRGWLTYRRLTRRSHRRTDVYANAEGIIPNDGDS